MPRPSVLWRWAGGCERWDVFMKRDSSWKVSLLSSLLALTVCGCVSFTDRDYELQKKAYERQEAQKEQLDQERMIYRW